MANTNTPAGKRRKAARNRIMLEQYQGGLPYSDIARLHGLSPSRVRTLIILEAARADREAELTLADSLAIQPNPLHLSAKTRSMVADAVRRDDFTREDVIAAGTATLLRIAGMTGAHWREVQAWLDRPRENGP